MGTLKTETYVFARLASVVDATLTSFAAETVVLPESSKSFKSVTLKVMATDLITVTGGTIGETRLAISIDGGADTTVTNTNDIVNSGEQMAPFISADFTAQFNSQFTGTSHSVVPKVYLDQTTGTTLNFVDATAILEITYECDETSSTIAATAFIPLDSVAGALATAKPGTALDTIPAFDTFFPETGKTYRSIKLVGLGNEAVAGATTAHTVTVQIDTLTAETTSSHTQALASDRMVMVVFNLMSGGAPIFTTNATHGFYAWASVARCNHFTWTIVVNYTFDGTGITEQNHSLRVPMQVASPMGGTTASDYQRASIDLFIPESSITLQKSACRLTFDAAAAVSGLNFRVGTQSFRAYTHTPAMVCGGNALQRTCDDGISLAQGKNTLTADVYRTDTADFGFGLGALWIINYRSAKPTGGYLKGNRTVMFNLKNHSTVAAAITTIISAVAPAIPETDFLISNCGIEVHDMSTGTTAPNGLNVQVERLSAEGGVKWEDVYMDQLQTDTEVGLRIYYGQARIFFIRYPGDLDSDRFNLETARRWRIFGMPAARYITLDLMFTYSAIVHTITKSVDGSNGGTVTVVLVRNSDKQAMKQTTRVGDGNVSFTWYIGNDSMHLEGREDDTHVGRSADFTVV